MRPCQGRVLDTTPGKRQELSKSWSSWRCVRSTADWGGGFSCCEQFRWAGVRDGGVSGLLCAECVYPSVTAWLNVW